MTSRTDDETQRRLDAVTDEEWEEIVLQLTRFAADRLWRRYWNTPDGHPPGGMDPGDFALNAIESLYSGRRTWDTKRHPELLVVLKGIVKSEISNLVNAHENTRRRVPARTEQEVRDGVPETSDRGIDPEERLLAEEERDEDARLLQIVRDSVEGSDELALVLEEVLAGKKAGEIAAELGLTAKEVYQMIRKIKRRAKTHLERVEAQE